MYCDKITANRRESTTLLPSFDTCFQAAAVVALAHQYSTKVASAQPAPEVVQVYSDLMVADDRAPNTPPATGAVSYHI